ncbi:MAG TPA: hypothetical protein V6D03_02395, partial [Candidatus Caenarcaniphilales bacterium]
MRQLEVTIATMSNATCRGSPMPLRWIRHLSRLILVTWKHFVGPKLVPLLSTLEVVGLGLAAIALWGFAEIADEVLEKEAFTLDTTLLLAIHRLHNPLLDRIMVGVTVVGQPTPLVLVTLALSLTLFVRRQRIEGVILAIAAAGAAGLNYLLKDLFARSRPQLWEQIVDVRYYSFPSGHAMLSV